MTIQITIIGLRQLGASLGLALKDHRELVKRTGHDRESTIARQAEKLGAIDQISYNLPASIRQADLVILTEPLDEMLKTLEIIAPDLREGAVVMDTSPVKAGIIELAEKVLPEGRHYVSILPSINPAYLFETSHEVEAAHPDLFQKGLFLIAQPLGTNPEAIKLAADLTNLLGATPLFTDSAEADGLSATVTQMPQVLAAAFLNATTEQPGWREARKLGGPEYALLSSPLAGKESGALAKAILMNRDNTLRWIDYISETLAELREAIQKNDEDSLSERLETAINARAAWLKQREAASWQDTGSTEQRATSAGDIFSRWLGVRRPGKDH
jgi:prephenate dehydrogenase